MFTQANNSMSEARTYRLTQKRERRENMQHKLPTSPTPHNGLLTRYRATQTYQSNNATQEYHTDQTDRLLRVVAIILLVVLVAVALSVGSGILTMHELLRVAGER